jgi:NADPH:quinone reductase-like Zn-dependent oxidoreductase
MKNVRIVITAHGGPDVLKLVEEEMPVPRPGEVRVRILATGVAFADILMRYGLYPGTPPIPFSPGYDSVGDVDAVGDGVSAFAVGDRVAALTQWGGYARYICLSAEQLTRVPDGLDPAEAVSLVLNYVTAYQMLHRVAEVESGQRILVHGGAGGVGTALLQLGRIAGLEMYATASRAKHDLITALGARPIDYRTDDFVARVMQMTGNRGVDAVFDAVGGTNWWRSYKTLKPGGRDAGGILVGYGVSSALRDGKPSKLVGAASFGLLGLLSLLPDGKRAVWYNISTFKKKKPEWFREDLAQLFTLLAEKKIAPEISERLPLREAARAHELLEHAKVAGKIVLLCQE